MMCGLQYVDQPNYDALLLRRTMRDLAQPGALMTRSHEWLAETDAEWDGVNYRWHFPSGATLTFGSLDNENDKYKYQGAQYAFVGFDEVTQFTQTQYTYLFSRLRKLDGSPIPTRMRAASNPGGVGHDWVRQHFLIAGPQNGVVFVPAKMDDNRFIDKADYLRQLNRMDPTTRAQLLHGDWRVRPPGDRFKREWFQIIQQAPAGCERVRFWDLAATISNTSAWTAGALLGYQAGRWYLLDMRRLRATPAGVEAAIKQQAALDGPDVIIAIEQEPGSGGLVTIDHYQREVLPGYGLRGHKPSASKIARSAPLANAAEAGNFFLVEGYNGGAWIEDWLDEVVGFHTGPWKDQVDAVSGGMEVLSESLRPHVYNLEEDGPVPEQERPPERRHSILDDSWDDDWRYERRRGQW